MVHLVRVRPLWHYHASVLVSPVDAQTAQGRWSLCDIGQSQGGVNAIAGPATQLQPLPGTILEPCFMPCSMVIAKLF